MALIGDGLESVDSEARKLLLFCLRKPRSAVRSFFGFAEKQKISFRNKIMRLEEEADFLNKLWQKRI